MSLPPAAELLQIVDFGFAKHLDTEERTYTFCGTPDYLPPEVVLGKGSGRQADYWALGVLTYELLVGHAPFLVCLKCIAYVLLRSSVRGTKVPHGRGRVLCMAGCCLS